MHETGIATEIINIINDTMRNRPAVEVRQVRVMIGELTAVLPESLNFAYRALTENTALQNSRLVITIIPVQAQCRTCYKPFAVQEFTFVCPFCGQSDIDLISGNELYIKEIEVD
ncbi:MAG TPA: hydrogenase maturation nickel metallochaperone HypA [bacterium]|nr:hydrogenase maturation nickel metallochaperone HypA [bacterium]HPN43448.1 hydrogenase maturation nickel metallochaperone HypA [bacterium]